MHLLSAENDLVSEFITTHSMEKKLLSVSSTKYLFSSKYLYPGADLGGGFS